MTNRLAEATSAYLRAHADNPVDWYPWGREPFDEARRRDVPVFLSVGYSTCHWCHVMARESFADEQTAAILNERFVAVKVDSEERPDVNAHYQRAVQAMTHRGGWPMSVFLTPDGEPFYAGSYWPARPSAGRPAFTRVLVAASEAWQHKRTQVAASVGRLAETLARADVGGTGAADPAFADDAARLALRARDREHGGFGTTPKFPHAMAIEWLLHRHARTGDAEALETSVAALTAMARGGIHDHVGGGFFRYALDREWRVPHFEKMLYDNALLLPAYATAAALTGDPALAAVARSTAHLLLTDLRTEHGAFASATDAEAAGVEGGFHTWSHDELVVALEESDVDSGLWAARLGATPAGNWDGTNVLHRFDPGNWTEDAATEWARIRPHLAEVRVRRVPPRTEDRVLTDWNALAVRGLVRAGLLLDEPEWLRAAATAATFLHEHLRVGTGLAHARKAGRATVDGFLLDHAAFALACLELFGATGDPAWFDRGLDLATRTHDRFHDEAGGWTQTARDGETLLTRHTEAGDAALPSGAAVFVEVCLVLAGLTGEDTWQRRAEDALATLQTAAATAPLAHGWLLRQLEALAAGRQEVVVVGRPGPARDALTRAVVAHPRPGTVTVTTEPTRGDRVPLLTGRTELDGAPAAYVCRDLSCARPVTTAAALAEQLRPLPAGAATRTAPNR
ncbi:thioredoxin domain-containing protein [Amycolatopsis rhabdoformis]|uniref:Thioredoxin domain-containing protein n=1 Tax=Amycolatopsis rhabdoformis TaxID=1448059 RepID=A0ABZ1ICM6_9PSEU|nr:thioredoxin domain-containing protein [Amycolatopsis rhabdoformis]WSE31309.1 thioredoxin domain-containing protein [Amycolatopsis rhabdoformis]